MNESNHTGSITEMRVYYKIYVLDVPGTRYYSQSCTYKQFQLLSYPVPVPESEGYEILTTRSDRAAI